MKCVSQYSHCLMDCKNDNGRVIETSPIVLDIDGKYRRTGNEAECTPELQVSVRYAVFVFVKFLIEYVMRNSHRDSASPPPIPEFWMSDASGSRKSKSGAGADLTVVGVSISWDIQTREDGAVKVIDDVQNLIDDEAGLACR